MIAKQLIIPLAFVLVTGIGAQEVQKQEGQKADIAEKVASQELRIEFLETELQTVMDYLAAQAESAKALATAMDEADKAGFTWGINPNAHELVLNGIRALSASIQKNVPGPKEKTEQEPEGPQRRGRQR